MNTKRVAAITLFSLLILMTAPSPIPAQTPGGTTGKTSSHKYDVMHGTVVVFTQRAITIQDAKQMYLVRTFSYDPKLLAKMQNRHYNKGDRVKVKFLHGTDVAVAVK